MLRILLPWLLIAACALSAGAAPPKPRPNTGSGVLVVQAPVAPVVAILYREPGVGRIGEFPLGQLSRLAPVMEAQAGQYLLAVMGTKGKWLRIAYDDAGREGWLEPARTWEYQPWERFLRGRHIRLLPGLTKGYYILRGEPVDAAPQLASPGRTQELHIVEVKGDWVMVSPDTNGWLRWRDEDGRFLISIDASFSPQKH